MPIVRILYKNHGAGDVKWDAKSQVAALPACHVGDENRGKVWRSTGAGTCEWLRVKMCSTSLAVDRVAFITYNFTSCAYIGIEAHCTSCFDDGAAPPGFTTCFAPWTASRTGVSFFDISAQQKRLWWRFVMCDTGVDDGYYQVGVVALGPATCMRVGPERLRYWIEDPSILDYAPAGTPKATLRDPYVMVELSHRFIAETLVFSGLQDVIRDGGRRKDMVLSLYTSEPSCTCAAVETNLYGRLEETLQFSYVLPGEYDAVVRFRESR